MNQEKLLIHIEGSFVEFLKVSGIERNLFVLVEPSLLHHTFLLGPARFTALHISALAKAITKSIGDVIGVPLQDNDTSIAHPIPTYKVGAPPKLIVKSTAAALETNSIQTDESQPNSSEADVFISESLTPFKKKLFGDVNKVKKHLKWKDIWTYNGRIFIRENEHKPSFSFDNAEDLNKFNLEHTNRARR